MSEISLVWFKGVWGISPTVFLFFWLEWYVVVVSTLFDCVDDG